MALSANTVLEVRTTGSDTNGGGFVTGGSGTDWSQQDSPQYSVTDAVANGTTTVTSATANFGTDVVGNIAYINGAWYQITARTNSTTITVDRTISSASGLTLKIGGCFATIQKALDLMTVVGMTTYVKATATYSISTKLTSAADISNFYARNRVIGYTTTRGDGGSVTVQTSAAVQGLEVTQSGMEFINFVFDGNNIGTVGVTGTGNYAFHFDNVQVKNFTSHGFTGVNVVCFNCRANNNGGNGFNNGIKYAAGCVAHNNTGYGIYATAAFACLAYNNTSDGFRLSGNVGAMLYCTSYGNSGDGIELVSYFSLAVLCIGNICYGNSGYGIRGVNAATTMAGSGFAYNAYGKNTTANLLNLVAGVGDVTLTATDTNGPFTDAASGDFSLNNAPNGSSTGGGAACRAAGFPGVFPGILTTGYLAIGAAQPQSSPTTNIVVISKTINNFNFPVES